MRDVVQINCPPHQYTSWQLDSRHGSQEPVRKSEAKIQNTFYYDFSVNHHSNGMEPKEHRRELYLVKTCKLHTPQEKDLESILDHTILRYSIAETTVIMIIRLLHIKSSYKKSIASMIHTMSLPQNLNFSKQLVSCITNSRPQTASFPPKIFITARGK